LSRRFILWDFDGTLAFREGMWARCLIDVLDDAQPGHGIDIAAVRPHLRDGFPWHAPDVPHPELADADAWWTHVGRVVASAYVCVGVDEQHAAALAVRVRSVYGDHRRSWTVFEDTEPALDALTATGWRHAILSNHVPELAAIVEGLGLARHFEALVNSAATGFEKPHPEAFACARRAVGNPGTLWMVGDNPEADVAGAEAAGIPAILVRRDAGGLDAVVRRLAGRAPSGTPGDPRSAR
jgi:putative hydrolase of the HAD superfamily